MNSSGRGSGHGHGFREGGGGGKNNGGGFGVHGYCICAKCGEKMRHQRGIKCTSIKCPSCQHTMVREELLNNKKIKNG